jgi:hypothetical protein
VRYMRLLVRGHEVPGAAAGRIQTVERPSEAVDFYDRRPRMTPIGPARPMAATKVKRRDALE